MTFIAELICAQAVFLYSYPKRKLFIVRALACCGVCLALAYLFPMPRGIAYNPYYSLFRFWVLFGYTFVGALICFKCKIGAVLVACVSGYALQHIVYHVYFMFSLIEVIPRKQWLEVIVCAVLYIVAFFTIGRYVAKKCFYNYYSKGMIAVSAFTLFICTVLSRFARLTQGGGNIIVICTSLYAITCCALVLVLQYFIFSFTIKKAENRTLQRISEEEKKQYEISKANIELLNIKCHDIKQRISEGEKIPEAYRESVSELVDIYDGTLKTGLEVLDIILNEKNLQCRKAGIKLTFLGDGKSLEFMNVMDIYSLFGNALTNAMEAVEKIDDEAKKVINITIEKRGDFIFIDAVNYFTGEYRVENGLPVTTKEDEEGFHGFGMKSINNIARSYNGGLTVSAEDGVFGLHVYLLDEANA